MFRADACADQMKAGPDIARDPLGACHHSANMLYGPEEARDLVMRGGEIYAPEGSIVLRPTQ